MSRQKLRIHRTDLDNLVSNLRGEVGEIIFTWVLLQDLMIKAQRLHSGDIAKDMHNRELRMLHILSDKLRDDIIAGLAELAEEKIGRLTFHFAQVKLGAFVSEVNEFGRFIEAKRFREKRNYDISHKELPEQWSEHKIMHIPYGTLLRGIAYALRLIKKIDRAVLGPCAPYLWCEMRKRRYEPMNPVKAGYLLLPYMGLTPMQRAEIITQEMTEGKTVWSEMKTTVDGVERSVLACKEWGAILLGPEMLMLPEYPLQELSSITTQFSEGSDAPATKTVVE